MLRIAIAGLPEKTIHYQNALRELGAEFICTLSLDGLSECDGLLLPGGGDIDPVFLNEENKGSANIDPKLDMAQFAILSEFVNAEKPVLGICRGHQVINVFFGGGMIQHLPTAVNHADNDEGEPAHATHAEKDSFIAKLYGEDFVVNSSHHQGLAKIGRGLRAVQHAVPDENVNEAICHETLPIYGVQWHPERMCFEKKRSDTVDGSKLIAFFLSECERVQALATAVLSDEN